MKVTLAYSMIEIEDAPAWLDSVGKYKFKSRKTPEEMRNEKALRKQLGKSTKVIPYKTEERSVMERDEKGRLYFLPGLWPRVQKKLDEHGEVHCPLRFSTFQTLTDMSGKAGSSGKERSLKPSAS